VEDLGRLPYRPLHVIGDGAHGIVLLVEHKRLGKRFVMKLIQQRFLADREIVGRFIAEAQRGAHLQHEAFAPIVDLGETEDGRPYFVMEYVDGMTMQRALLERGALPVEEAVSLAMQVLDGLAAAHEAHIIHRDIKPANLFLTTRGRVKILDLGISKSILDAGSGPNTAAGLAVGTPKYMAPEQAVGGTVTYATDVYGVGLVLFEMLAGRPPFDGASAQELMYHQLQTPAPSLWERAQRWFPERVEDVVATALRKDPAMRFQTAREMFAALQLATHPHPAERTTSEKARPTMRMIGAAPPPPEAYPTNHFAPAIPAPRHELANAPTQAMAVIPYIARPTADALAAFSRTDSETIAAADAPPARHRGSRGIVTLVAALAVSGLVATAVITTRARSADRGSSAASATAAPPSASATVVPVLEMSAAPSAPLASPPSPPPSAAPSSSTNPVKSATPAPAKSNAALHYQAARDAMNGGDLATADSEARLAIANGGGSHAQLLLGQVLEQRGKKAAAREVYQQILDKDPTMSAAAAGVKRCSG